MKYWVYLNGEVPGSYSPEELAAIPGIAETTMICPASGGIEERNWMRAGQFPDVVDALRRAAAPPLAPQAPLPGRSIEPGRPLDPNDILNDSSSRLFRHVSDLMKELENRRAERAMTQSLQRQLVELKNELLALRERNQYLQERADLIPGFQEREDRLQKDHDAARQRLQEREAALRNSESDAAKAKEALEKALRVESSLSQDLKGQAETIDELNGQLAQKEFTLAKAFGVIRRLEEVLGELLPGTVSGISSEVPGYITEEAPPPPPREEAAEEPVVAAEPEVEEVAAAVPEAPPEAEPEPEPEAPPQPEIKVRQPQPQEEAAPEEPEWRPQPDPIISDLASSSYTVDTGEPPKRMDLPPEGEVTPVPPPWTKIVDKIKMFFLPEKESLPEPEQPPPAPRPDDQN